MNTARQNAPLVELIAELRWEPAGATVVQAQAGGPGHTFFAGEATSLDEFFMRFGGVMHGKGYAETERVVPSGFPIMAHQPVYRFKEKQSAETGSLYQVGAGIFSANATPPYESWTKFRKIVKSGVETLLDTRSQAESARPFVATNFRYIDAFLPSHTGERDINELLSEVFGIAITVPPALSQHLLPGAAVKPVIQMQIPMANGMLMHIGFGEGSVRGVPAIMMDTAVATTQPVEASVEAVMAVFEKAHDAIAASFSMLIKPIEQFMPKKEGVEQ